MQKVKKGNFIACIIKSLMKKAAFKAALMLKKFIIQHSWRY